MVIFFIILNLKCEQFKAVHRKKVILFFLAQSLFYIPFVLSLLIEKLKMTDFSLWLHVPGACLVWSEDKESCALLII